MPHSLKVLLSKLRYKGHISGDEYKALLAKMEGHDREIKEEAYRRGHADANKTILPVVKELHDGVYTEGYKAGYEKALRERKKVLDEVYAIALNETHDTLIEWLQNNIQD